MLPLALLGPFHCRLLKGRVPDQSRCRVVGAVLVVVPENHGLVGSARLRDSILGRTSRASGVVVGVAGLVATAAGSRGRSSLLAGDRSRSSRRRVSRSGGWGKGNGDLGGGLLAVAVMGSANVRPVGGAGGRRRDSVLGKGASSHVLGDSHIGDVGDDVTLDGLSKSTSGQGGDKKS